MQERNDLVGMPFGCLSLSCILIEGSFAARSANGYGMRGTKMPVRVLYSNIRRQQHLHGVAFRQRQSATLYGS